MLPGFSGHLVSEAFLDAACRLEGSADIVPLGAARRRLLQWRAGALDVGPASSPRALLEDRARPLLTALGFASPADIEAVEAGLVATVAHDGRSVLLVVTRWGDRLDPLWRLAVTHAMRRSSAWCVLFNGAHLRIIDAGRLYARRCLDFDLDLTLDDARSLAALWRTARAEALCGVSANPASLHAIVAASDRHAATVCRSLRDGVLAASGDVLVALAVRGRTPLSTE